MTPLYAIMRLRDALVKGVGYDSAFMRDVKQHIVVELEPEEWEALAENLGPFFSYRSDTDMRILREVTVSGIRVRRKEPAPPISSDWLDSY